jgi:alanyl-tRNA synthetase
MALFGEKYGDHVRALNLAKAWNFGGIHVKNTGNLVF